MRKGRQRKKFVVSLLLVLRALLDPPPLETWGSPVIWVCTHLDPEQLHGSQLGQEAGAPASSVWLVLLRKFLVRVRFSTGGEKYCSKITIFIPYADFFSFSFVRILLVV